MVVKIFLVTLLVIGSHAGYTQQVAPLFREEAPLSIRFSIAILELKKEKQDSVYFPSVLSYKNAAGTWDSIPITVRARGNFRRKHCYFPPLRIKIKKEDRANTIFEGTKSLKLVLPCQTAKSNDDLIMKEFVCYQLYEPTTPYVFGTRLLDITLVDISGKHEKVHQLRGFFIEDDDAVAKRFNAKVVDEAKLHPLLLQDTCSLRHDMFQYMIGNTDYSTTFFHNAKVIKTKSGHYIPIAYDFDMAGFVNAPYATFDENLNIGSVRDRIYRGFCRGDEITQYVRTEYINLEPAITEVINKYQDYFDPREFSGVKKYMNDFFSTIKDDGVYKMKIAQACRTR